MNAGTVPQDFCSDACDVRVTAWFLNLWVSTHSMGGCRLLRNDIKIVRSMHNFGKWVSFNDMGELGNVSAPGELLREVFRDCTGAFYSLL
jgi:hypothetical protein